MDFRSQMTAKISIDGHAGNLSEAIFDPVYPPSQKAMGVSPWMNARWVPSVALARDGTPRPSPSEVGYGRRRSEGSAPRSVWRGATAVRLWDSTRNHFHSGPDRTVGNRLCYVGLGAVTFAFGEITAGHAGRLFCAAFKRACYFKSDQFFAVSASPEAQMAAAMMYIQE